MPNNDKISFSDSIRQCPPYKKQLIENGARSQLYQDILEETEADRVLYLAIRQSTYKELFCVPIGMLLLKKSRLRLIVFNPNQEEIVQWIP